MYPKRTFNALGLAELLNGDIELAEGYFSKAVTTDSNYAEAIVNLGATSLAKKNYMRAEKFLKNAILL